MSRLPPPAFAQTKTSECISGDEVIVFSCTKLAQLVRDAIRRYTEYIEGIDSAALKEVRVERKWHGLKPQLRTQVLNLVEHRIKVAQRQVCSKGCRFHAYAACALSETNAL